MAQFTLSAVRSVQSCSSTYKYSVRLQRYNSPRGLYLEAPTVVSKSIVYIPLQGGEKEELYTGRKKSIFLGQEAGLPKTGYSRLAV